MKIANKLCFMTSISELVGSFYARSNIFLGWRDEREMESIVLYFKVCPCDPFFTVFWGINGMN